MTAHSTSRGERTDRGWRRRWKVVAASVEDKNYAAKGGGGGWRASGGPYLWNVDFAAAKLFEHDL